VLRALAADRDSLVARWAAALSRDGDAADADPAGGGANPARAKIQSKKGGQGE
jgi:hypothetical protein